MGSIASMIRYAHDNPEPALFECQCGLCPKTEPAIFVRKPFLRRKLIDLSRVGLDPIKPREDD